MNPEHLKNVVGILLVWNVTLTLAIIMIHGNVQWLMKEIVKYLNGK